MNLLNYFYLLFIGLQRTITLTAYVIFAKLFINYNQMEVLLSILTLFIITSYNSQA